jgi:hypothetical protein
MKKWFDLPTTDGLIYAPCSKCSMSVRVSEDVARNSTIICEACKNPREFAGSFYGD